MKISNLSRVQHAAHAARRSADGSSPAASKAWRDRSRAMPVRPTVPPTARACAAPASVRRSNGGGSGKGMVSSAMVGRGRPVARAPDRNQFNFWISGTESVRRNRTLADLLVQLSVARLSTSISKPGIRRPPLDACDRVSSAKGQRQASDNVVANSAAQGAGKRTGHSVSVVPGLQQLARRLQQCLPIAGPRERRTNASAQLADIRPCCENRQSPPISRWLDLALV